MTPADIAARLAIYDRVLAGAKCGRPAPHGMVCTNPEGHAGECRGGAGRPVAHAEVAALWSESGPALEWLDCVRVLLAEVRRLTAERATALEAISDAGDYVEGDSLIDSINELITDTDGIRRQGRRENEAGDIVGEIRPMLGGVDQEGVIRAVAEVVDERDALRARVAELEEAARWRPAREAVPSAEPVAITLYVMGIPTRSEGRKTGPNNWKTPHGSRYDADILGWRPLGPGPVAP